MTDITSFKTCELVEELKRREGVEVHLAGNPDHFYTLSVSDRGRKRFVSGDSGRGPATILVVVD